jgi:ribosome-associated protein
MSTQPIQEREPVWEAVEAARDKKAQAMVLLHIGEVTSFTDYFLICSGASSRQVQSICDEIERRLLLLGLRAAHIEGYNHAEWVLMDYGDFVVHVFSVRARSFYDLERLWKTAPRVALGPEG